MKKRAKWLSILLAVTLMAGSTAGVYADEGTDAGTVVQSQSEEIQSEDDADVSAESEVSDADEEESAVEEDAVTEEQEPVYDSGEENAAGITVTDHGDGVLDLQLNGYTKTASSSKIVFAVWSAKNDQDDLKWYDAKDDASYTMNTKDHNDDLGAYNIHAYEKNGTAMTLICYTSVNVPEINRPDPAVTAEDTAGDEKTFAITLKNYSKPSGTKGLVAAVWSDQGDQDDLKWYNLTEQTDGTYTGSISIAAHKTSGNYNVHVYQKNSDNSMTLVAKNTFTVAAPTCSSIETTDQDTTKGTCRIVISGLTVPSGVTKVQVPVWSKSNQSDIVWYDAQKQDDGTYTVDMSLSRHSFNIGTYQIHVYATDGNGIMSYVGKTSVTFNETPKAVVSAVQQDSLYLLKAENITTSKASAVSFAVWSEDKGQDDLKWFAGTYDASSASAQYSLNLNAFSSVGTYHVHAYVRTTDGKMVFLGQTSFEAEKDDFSTAAVTAETDNAQGDFTLTVKGLSLNVKTVQIPVWSKSDQSDIVWYTATRDDKTGYYVVKSNISKHSYNAGTYQAHVYVTDNSGTRSFAVKTTFEFSSMKGEVSVEEVTANTEYKALITGMSLPGGVSNVRFAVWSEKKGQDDLKWYTASGKNGSTWSATISVKNHKTEGRYFVHAYAEDAKGTNVLIGTTEFTVTASASASVTAGSPNSESGSFTVTVTPQNPTSPVSSVQIPVWSKSDQSDIHWYTATKQSDGTWTATVKVSNHNLNLGTFAIHCYITMQNGIQKFAGSTSYTFNPSNFVGVIKTGNGKRQVTLKNYSGSASSMYFAVWSDTSGQDDIKWYPATKQSDGTWTATIESQYHKHSGLYYVHCYANGKTFVGNATFSFAESEMVKNGWYYENGYKFYYSNGTKLTDLTSIIPVRSFYITVNRQTCTVNVFSLDPDTNTYIIPVIAFACSVGLPGTETTYGIHYTGEKYRWKELMGPSYGQYATRVTSDGIYFHSVAGTNMTSYNLSYIDYNNLGYPASHGCIRLCVRDAKWIYDNIPTGTMVNVYDDTYNPGPYGKPATIKIPAGQTWDPTDPAITG